MREVTDEALQRLYWAARQGDVLPGEVPADINSPITTNQILTGLGLTIPGEDDDFSPPHQAANEEKDSQLHHLNNLQPTRPYTPVLPTHQQQGSQSPTSSSHYNSTQSSKDSHSTTTSPFYIARCCPSKTDMCEQFCFEGITAHDPKPKAIAPKPTTPTFQFVQIPYRMERPQQYENNANLPAIDPSAFFNNARTSSSSCIQNSQVLAAPAQHQLPPLHEPDDNQSEFNINDFELNMESLMAPPSWEPDTYAAAYSTLAQDNDLYYLGGSSLQFTPGCS